jgi:hypothetical protein
MTTCLLRISSAAGVALACSTALHGADRGAEPAQRPQVPVEVSMKIAGQPYVAKGSGSCTHEPKGSIYDVVSEMWTAIYQDGGRSVHLTFWKPVNGSAPMFTLAAIGKPGTNVSTVRGGPVTGSGTVTFAPSGKGGTFTVDAKSKAGEPVTGTIKCDAFTPAIAEGGD